MATMAARYDGRCRACGGGIRAGQQIDYGRDTGARHPACAAGRAAGERRAKSGSPRASAPLKSAYPSTPPEPGAHEISGRREGRGDVRYEVGQVIRAGRVSVPGGGPDGHYYVVLARHIVAPNEDAGHYSWTEEAWVRAATTEEAAPVAERRTAAEARQAARADLERRIIAEHRVSGEDARMCRPVAGAVQQRLDISPRRSVVMTDTEVALLESGCDDGATWHASRTDELAALVAAAGGVQ